MKNKIQKKALIVMPTYNEADNIGKTLDKIFVNERKNKNKFTTEIVVLVVDDDSPDGTAEVVKKYPKFNRKVYLLLRKEKEGLGAAYIAGMKYGMRKFRPDIVFEMDADGQHNPKDIYRLIKEVNNGSDFVIGSRYVNGGKVPKSWGWHRKLISSLASGVTRVGLGLKGIRDVSGGFRAMKKKVIKGIDLDKLEVKGYAFQAALLEVAVHHHYNVKEVPISFRQRKSGESKMRFSDMLEGWKVIIKTKIKRLFNKGA